MTTSRDSASARPVPKQLASQTIQLGAIQKSFERRIADWSVQGFARALWAKDYRLWSPQPVPEISNRMGWLSLPESMQSQAGDISSFADRVRDEGFRHVVLLGMGGSSLAPDLFQIAFGNAPSRPELIVLDSTHPGAVRSVEARIDLARTLFVVSSKSGTTLEPLSFFHYFWKRVGEKNPKPGQQFVAITDPATPLETLAREREFRRAFLATPDVGGRYSALTVFGLVPAALIGVDINELLDRASAMAQACGASVHSSQNPALLLGAALGELALAGRDKVTFLTSPALDSFAAWAEQLIAESTGKDGKGIVPIAGEPPGPPEAYGVDRVFVRLHLGSESTEERNPLFAALPPAGAPSIEIHLSDMLDLAQEFFCWEIAIAAAGAVLGIHPFNQPDVEMAKDLARKAMAQGAASPAAVRTVPASDSGALLPALREWMSGAAPGRYAAIQAYLAPANETTAHLQELRVLIRNRAKLATTLGYGPRFLHSTGQLHKGGPNSGLFLQLVDEPAADLAVPETDFTFGSLIRAQALGDYQALTQRGRRVLRVNLGGDVSGGLANIRRAFENFFDGAPHA
jgi:transaldolase/glucose-6-phosphate isomerase